ncbi:EAL domain-containing protein (putative c-di-GMP-specific phosphodiesterase class I) [Rhizobium lentis]|uniref:EAL domain-containing protein (Putative c-di-GMP-specific phosphodiesterase class I) n=1 Tax=Rhizobium lentis TaxID=1138194 RepID=A0A7W8UKF6_9HYPH|nr:EAL domain-containing protein (putative c-di-GMP-specific phosphodiesterase class I) [Rhizobium lentis]MBB5548950.1 EAL domain-containing protein (putative c-di-GMP-specific phosphodiesterase class I) [Rhizobium lentis]MBB5559483.1 EAL domain-containing protein (putative c-di-GMP-specific phosphodiesterase class I) [Rhizobium lentis]MBB5564995.1 EAL domain-containing protein (putative c-di-GMP-specific phosphodiesterase class I) [Rhizobium lentis]
MRRRHAARSYDDIKQLGINIEIDDFGSGHASRSRVVSSIVEIAKALDVWVIADGVETEAHATVLAQLGCDGLQALWLSRAGKPGSDKRLNVGEIAYSPPAGR